MSLALTRELALRLEAVEAAAWRELHESSLEADRSALGLRARELAGAWVMAVDRDVSLLHNRVVGLGLREPITAAVLDALLIHFRGHDAGFAINLSPFAEPAGVERDLAQRGFGTFFHHLKWVRGPEPAPEARTSLRVEVASQAQSVEWGKLSARISGASPAHAAWSSRCVGRDGWSHYFAYEGDAAVAVGALFVRDGAAWLGGAATLERHRRRGAQSALFARRIADALAQDARWLTTETAPDWADLPGESLRNAARAGFHTAYERPSWIWPVPR